MRSVAIYPGSFNPFHDGHHDILSKALRTFSYVVIAVGHNPDKDLDDTKKIVESIQKRYGDLIDGQLMDVAAFDGLLVDFVSKLERKCEDSNLELKAIVRGLRNGHDLQYEMIQQYWNEDLGLEIPIVHFICDRNTAHISSSMIRAIKKFKDPS